MKKTLDTFNKKRFIWAKIEQEDKATYIDCMFVRRLLIIEDVRKMPTEMMEWDASISFKFSPNQLGETSAAEVNAGFMCGLSGPYVCVGSWSVSICAYR